MDIINDLKAEAIDILHELKEAQVYMLFFMLVCICISYDIA